MQGGERKESSYITAEPRSDEKPRGQLGFATFAFLSVSENLIVETNSLQFYLIQGVLE